MSIRAPLGRLSAEQYLALSKRTEPDDRSLECESYRALPSVTDYLLVSQSTALIEHYQRQASGEWRYRAAEAGDTVRLPLGATLEVDTLFAGVLELSGERAPAEVVPAMVSTAD